MADDDSSQTVQWQERTVERSLKAARQRAISRGNTFIGAAVELLRTTGKADFTVQEVVDKSGMSLRSFYQHFGSKDDLLLAVVEESVRRHIESAHRKVAAEKEPIAKLRALIVALFGSHETDDPASRGLALFHWHLAEARSDEYTATIRRYVDTVAEILDAGLEQGCFRTDVPVQAMAGLVIHTLVSILDMRVLGVETVKPEITAEQVVRWCVAAVQAPTTPIPTTGTTKRTKR